MIAEKIGQEIGQTQKLSSGLSFDGGILNIQISGYLDNGYGELVIKDDDLDWGTHSEDVEYRVLKLPRSELEAIYRHIGKCLAQADEGSK